MMQIVDKDGNIFGPGISVNGPDGKPKTIGGGVPIGPAGGDLSGTYPNPSVTWVNGATTYNAKYYPLSTNPAGYINGLTVGTTPISSGTNGRVLFQSSGVLQQSANFFWDNTNSRLGIGTSTPLLNLDLSGTGQVTARIVSTNNLGARFDLHSSGGGRYSQQALANGDYFMFDETNAHNVQRYFDGASGAWVWYTVGVERMRIDNTGKVGIGQTSPAAKLDILAQGALSTDLGLRVRNSANTADLFNVQGNGITNVSTLTASNQINISQPTGLYYPTIAFTANGTQSCGTIEGYNSGLYIRNTAYLNLNSPSVYVGGYGTGAASAVFTITSTTKGFLPPRMTTTEKNAITSPAAGLVVYDTTLGKLCLRGAAAWETITSI